MDGHEGTANAGLTVDRIVNLLDVRREFLVQLAHPRGRGGRDDDLEIGHPQFQSGDQLGGHVDLTDADRVDPEHVPVRHGLLDLGAELAKALGKALLPVAPAPHTNKVVRRAQTKEDDEQNIVDQPHRVLKTASITIPPETRSAGKIKSGKVAGNRPEDRAASPIA